jgi:hypothetical protein
MSPRVLAWAMTSIMTAAVCVSAARIPIQVTDSLVPILQAQQTPSVTSAFFSSLGAAYLRPMRVAQIQALFELSRGRYFLAYKSFHVALVIACFALFMIALHVRTHADVAALPFALTVLAGLHTFRGMVWEAYPINHFLEISVLCLCALVLAQSRGGWWADLGASLTFVVAALTLESGLLVWVVVVTAWWAGWRGISRRGVIAVTVLLGLYFLVRFPFLDTGAPTLAERGSGFGFGRLEPGDLARRFGGWPYGFYAYNVVSSFLSVLLSEPRGGTWTAVADLAGGRFAPGTLVNVVCSLITTIAIGWFIVKRRGGRRLRSGEIPGVVSGFSRTRFDDGDRTCIVALAVLVANAAISYAYTKDEIMSPAGVFYALAAFVAIREVVRRARPRTRLMNIAYGAALVVAASGWAVRTAGLHYQMHAMGFSVRNEWVYVDDWLARQQATPATDAGRHIVETLRNDALGHAVVNPYLQAQSARALRLFP